MSHRRDNVKVLEMALTRSGVDVRSLILLLCLLILVVLLITGLT